MRRILAAVAVVVATASLTSCAAPDPFIDAPTPPPTPVAIPEVVTLCKQLAFVLGDGENALLRQSQGLYTQAQVDAVTRIESFNLNLLAADESLPLHPQLAALVAAETGEQPDVFGTPFDPSRTEFVQARSDLQRACVASGGELPQIAASVG